MKTVFAFFFTCLFGLNAHAQSNATPTLPPHSDTQPTIAEKAQHTIQSHPEWKVPTVEAAVSRCKAIIGKATEDVRVVKTYVVGDADASLITDEPISVNNPAWLVATAPVSFDLKLPDSDAHVRTPPLPFEVLVRARDGAILRLQTPPFRVPELQATVESLSAHDYVEHVGHEYWKISSTSVSLESTLSEVLQSIMLGCGGPDSAQQIVAYIWNWSAPVRDCQHMQPTWAVELRVSAFHGSQTGALESRLPEDSRPLVSNLVHMVHDETRKWLFGTNCVKPILRRDDGTLVLSRKDIEKVDPEAKKIPTPEERK